MTTGRKPSGEGGSRARPADLLSGWLGEEQKDDSRQHVYLNPHSCVTTMMTAASAPSWARWVVGAILLALCRPCYQYQLNFTHHDLQEVNSFLREVNTLYPSITHLYSIGKAVHGNDLWVLAVGQSPRNVDVDLRPQVALIGSTQGNAVVGCENLLHLIDYLVTEYGQNETVTSLLQTTNVHIMITLNPDAYVWSHVRKDGPDVDRCRDNFARQNANNADLNRDYPDVFLPRAMIRQPETQAVMRWFSTFPFVLAAYFYGAALSVAYPYQNNAAPTRDPVYSASVDDDVYRHIATVYANAHTTMHLGQGCPNINFPTAFEGGIVNGAAWYKVSGTLSDYASGMLNIPTMGIAVSCCKYPPESDLQGLWDENKDALIAYIRFANTGVKGRVLTLEGVEVRGAWVTVEGREANRRKTTPFGEYWRLLLPGEYTLEVKARGFHAQRRTFSVEAGLVTQLDVYLEKMKRRQPTRVEDSLPLCEDQVRLLPCPPDHGHGRRQYVRQVYQDVAADRQQRVENLMDDSSEGN